MIYCVRYEDVVAHIESLAFRLIEATEEGRAFVRAGQRLSLRGPNVNGDLPEVLVNDAFDTAGLSPPEWNVFWCD